MSFFLFFCWQRKQFRRAELFLLEVHTGLFVENSLDAELLGVYDAYITKLNRIVILTEDRRQRTEDRGQRTEDRRQRTEDRGRKTEDR